MEVQVHTNKRGVFWFSHVGSILDPRGSFSHSMAMTRRAAERRAIRKYKNWKPDPEPRTIEI